MAMQAGRLTDERYLNWIKDTIALLYVKEGLEVFVDCQSAVFHGQLKAAISMHGQLKAAASNQTCTCNWQALSKGKQSWKVKCISGLCQNWLDLIISHHRYRPLPNLETKNTDPRLWPSDCWEIVKVYQPKGCQKQHSAKDADVAGLLTLLNNCDHFFQFINSLQLIDELLAIRNRLMHSSDFLVENVHLTRDLQNMLQFLRSITSLSATEKQSIQIAIDKIEELRANRLDLSLNRELELKAIRAKQVALETEMRILGQSITDVSNESTRVGSGLNTLQDKVDTEVETLQQRLNSLLSMIQYIEKEMTMHQQSTGAVLNNLTHLQQQFDVLEEDLEKMKNNLASVSDMKQRLADLHLANIQQGSQINTLYQKQQTAESELQVQLRELQEKYDNLRSQLQFQETKLAHLGDGKKNEKADGLAKELTNEDIPALQMFLKDYYRSTCLTVPNPVVPEEVGLDHVYVDPDIKVLRETTDPRSGLVNVRDQAMQGNTSQCRRIFYTKDYKCKQIYITGRAGAGKSIFCKHLVNLWCQAHSDIGINEATNSDPEDSETEDLHWPTSRQQRELKRKQRESRSRKLEEDDRRIMSEFKLLFYITLRDSSNEYHVSDMIDSQILHHSEDMQNMSASALLKGVRCLVIVDGLDEWVCPRDAKVPHFVNPGIPGRNWLNRNSVFLTTTRSWKFDVLELKSSEVDKHVEFVGLNSTSSRRLCSKIIKMLNRTERVERTTQEFWTEMKKKGLTHFHNVPLILTQLLCLWFDKQDLGQSQVQLYCSMLEMLLKRALKNLSGQTSSTAQTTQTIELIWMVFTTVVDKLSFFTRLLHIQSILRYLRAIRNDLPPCFSGHTQCQVHQDLLLSLSKVAFDALFDQKKEHSLVFKSSQMDLCGVGQEYVDLCLKSGILSQNKVLGKWSVSEKKMSFLHSKLQEFLAAIFITKCENVHHVFPRVTSFCSTVDAMLEMSQVWMFVSGIKPEISKDLLTDLMTEVVLNDRRLTQDRQTLAYPALQPSLQTLIVDCVVEAKSNGHRDFCLPLEDFVITNMTISECLEYLFALNIAATKYVYIDTHKIESHDGMETIEHILCKLQDARCLQKLYLSDRGSVIKDMESLRQTLVNNENNLTCLELWYITMTTRLSDVVCETLKHVMALKLFWVRLTHEQLEQVLSSLSQADSVRQLDLRWLYCLDHDEQCRPSIDLSGHTHLHTLILAQVYVDNLPAVSHCVEFVKLLCVTIAERQLRQFVRALSSIPHRATVELYTVTVTGNSEGPVDLTDLRHNDKLDFTCCQYFDSNNTWTIEFHTATDDH